MKTLQINYDKKYLLVEPSKECYHTISDSAVFFQDAETHKSEHIEGKFKFVCMGNEFEKDVKEGCLLGKIFAAMGQGAFVEEIEKSGFYWDKNPFDKECDLLVSDNSALGCAKYRKAFHKWQEAEEKTFNPHNTFIFEKL